MILRRLLDRSLAPLGYQVIPRRAPAPSPVTMPALVRRVAQRGLGIRTVIDVGSAAGRWTRKALPLFEDARFLLIEPLEERRAQLAALRAEHPRVHFTIAAAGRAAGTAKLNIAEDLDGSGIYERNGSTPSREVPVTAID